MRLGVSLAHLSDAPPFPAARWAARLEQAGFEGLWTPEVIGRGALVPDPFVLLAAAAAVTERVELGTATVQVPLHHPAELAHRVRSLLSVSGDRLTLGVSPGSTQADFTLLDRDFRSRFTTLHAHVARLRSLLPPPQDGGPEVLLGSWGANVERAARDYDGWVASAVRRTPEQLLEALVGFRAAGGGRAVVMGVRVEDDDDLAPARDVLHRCADAGFDDAVVLIGPHGPDPERVRALHP